MLRLVFAVSVATASLLAMLAPRAGPVGAVPSSLTSADEIYLRALKAMKALPLPKYVIFRSDYWGRNVRLSCEADGFDMGIHHGDSFSSYRVWYRVTDASSVMVDPKTHYRCDDSLIDPAGTQVATLGEGTPAPKPSATAGAGDLRLIGGIRVESVRFYRVALAGVETIDGHPAYHLTLRAYKPLDHPLTDLWVDTASSLIRRMRAQVSLHFLIASGYGNYVGSFDRFGRYWLLDNEHLEFAGNATFFHLRATVHVRASDFSFPDELPAGIFPSPSPSPSPSPNKHA